MFWGISGASPGAAAALPWVPADPLDPLDGVEWAMDTYRMTLSLWMMTVSLEPG